MRRQENMINKLDMKYKDEKENEGDENRRRGDDRKR